MRKRTLFMISIGLICCSFFAIYLLWGNDRRDNVDKDYTSMTLSKLQKELTENEQELKSVEKDLRMKEKALSKSELDEKGLNKIAKDIEIAQNTLLDVQKEALYVGKFICKVNTCQGNPKDKNYPTFLNITNRLVEVKDNLQDLKDKEEEMKNSASKAKTYKNDIVDCKEKLKQLRNIKQNVEKVITAR